MRSAAFRSALPTAALVLALPACDGSEGTESGADAGAADATEGGGASAEAATDAGEVSHDVSGSELEGRADALEVSDDAAGGGPMPDQAGSGPDDADGDVTADAPGHGPIPSDVEVQGPFAEQGLGAAKCPETAPGTSVGPEVGDRLAELELRTCDGEPFTIRDLCGAQALWLLRAHAWCPTCKSMSDAMEGIHDDFADRGLVTVNVVVQTPSFEPPDEATCEDWRDGFGLDDAIVAYDPNGATDPLDTDNSTSLNVFADEAQVMVDKIYTSSSTTVESTLEELLPPSDG